jgi:hypothetical protein
VQERQKLAAVQVPPHALGKVVINRQFRAAFRACKACPRDVRRMYLDMHLRHVQLDALHRPRLNQAQQMPIQLLALHRAPSLKALRDSVSLTHIKV